jgi:hypothetical protein
MKINKFIATSLLASALLGAAAFAQSPASPSAPTPTEFVYVPQLPSAADLTKAAATDGVTVLQINQTSNEVVVVYKYSNGLTTTVAYQPLAAADSGAVPAPAAPAVVTTAAVPATVVYQTAPAYYYDPYPYWGWGWYPPVSIGFGFGFHGGGFRGGGFRGHFR